MMKRPRLELRLIGASPSSRAVNAYEYPTSPPQYLGAYTDTNWPSFGGCTGK